jgi:hypothetical protein
VAHDVHPVMATRGCHLAALLLGAASVSPGCSSTAPVGVRTVDTVLVDPSTVTLVIGEDVALAASLRDEFGVAFSGIPVRWVSDDEAVAVVSGKRRNLSAGQSYLSAGYEYCSSH